MTDEELRHLFESNLEDPRPPELIAELQRIQSMEDRLSSLQSRVSRLESIIREPFPV